MLNDPQTPIPFIDSHTMEVTLKLLHEEWTPILSFQMIILALELALGEEALETPSPIKSAQSSVDFHNEYYQL